MFLCFKMDDDDDENDGNDCNYSDFTHFDIYSSVDDNVITTKR